MSNNKTFQIALLVSVMIHSVFFLGLPSMPFLPSKRSLENLKITYYKIKEAPPKPKVIDKKVEPIAKKLPEIKKEDILKPVPKIAPPKTEKKSIKTAIKEKKGIIQVKQVKEKKFEKVIEEEKDAAKKATYISYYRAVREKIRNSADQFYPRGRFLGEGEVFLSFIVASSGELLQVRLIDERSIDNSFLRNIAVKSIKNASPFPPFPEGMYHYQIMFSVILAFEEYR